MNGTHNDINLISSWLWSENSWGIYCTQLQIISLGLHWHVPSRQSSVTCTCFTYPHILITKHLFQHFLTNFSILAPVLRYYTVCLHMSCDVMTTGTNIFRANFHLAWGQQVQTYFSPGLGTRLATSEVQHHVYMTI